MVTSPALVTTEDRSVTVRAAKGFSFGLSYKHSRVVAGSWTLLVLMVVGVMYCLPYTFGLGGTR